MGDRSARLARGLGHRHRDALPAAAPAEPRSWAWLAILVFGAVAVGLYYAPFLGPNWQAVEYLATEAITAEHPGPIDLLLTDVVMPGGNGADLAARLSALRPTMKVLMMTGYAQETIVDQGGLKAGIVLIEKPLARTCCWPASVWPSMPRR